MLRLRMIPGLLFRHRQEVALKIKITLLGKNIILGQLRNDRISWGCELSFFLLFLLTFFPYSIPNYKSTSPCIISSFQNCLIFVILNFDEEKIYQIAFVSLVAHGVVVEEHVNGNVLKINVFQISIKFIEIENHILEKVLETLPRLFRKSIDFKISLLNTSF